MLHDPDGLLVLEDEDISVSLAEAVDQVRQRRVTGEWLVNRAIARGHVAEAVNWYLRFGLEPVVRLLRVEHCPWRHDYGLRYLREDLPPDVADRVEELGPGPPLPRSKSSPCAASPGSTSCSSTGRQICPRLPTTTLDSAIPHLPQETPMRKLVAILSTLFIAGDTPQSRAPPTRRRPTTSATAASPTPRRPTPPP